MVKLAEFSAEDITDKIQFHDELSPALWAGDNLRLDVRLHLFKTAIAFYRFLDVTGLVVSDIVMTGSSAAFNYTSLSDIDVHLIVDYEQTVCPKLAENFFTTKKNLWAKTYDIEINGMPVELYVEDALRPAQSNGLYSILHGKWLKHAKPIAPKPDDRSIVAKTEQFSAEIDALLDNPAPDQIEDMLARLKALRQSGLLSGGEFSTENLTFKALRNLGYMDKLWSARIEALQSSLSLGEAPSPTHGASVR